MSDAKLSIFTAYGISCQAIVADPNDVDVTYIADPGTIKSAAKYGINGTFYGSGSIAGLALTYGGSPIAPGSDVQPVRNGSPLTRGTLICYQPPTGGLLAYATPVISRLSDTAYQPSWVRWAISGLSLHLDSSSSDATVISNVATQEQTNPGVYGWDTTTACNRTAIGYRNADGKTILLAAANCTVPELRNIMKNYVGCNDAITLDGNPSTMLRAYDTTNPSTYVYEFASVNLPTLSYVTVNPSSWSHS